MTLTVDIKKSFALSVLEGLEQIGAISIQNDNSDTSGDTKKAYKAIKLHLKDFRFNREEANER